MQSWSGPSQRPCMMSGDSIGWRLSTADSSGILAP